MKRKWKIGLAVLCVVGLATVAYAAAAGGPEDPLVTLSYLKGVFTGQVQEMVDSTVDANREQVKNDLDQAIRDWDAQVSAAIEQVDTGNGGDAQFTSLTLRPGQTLSLKAGSEVIVTSGSASADAALVNESAGSTLSAGSALAVNHLYLAGSNCAVTVCAAQRTGTVKEGPLNVRSGAGTGYSMVGKLPAGTTVTILDQGTGSWYRVSGGGLTGYVSASYITLDPAPQSAPVTLMVRGGYVVQ